MVVALPITEDLGGHVLHNLALQLFVPGALALTTHEQSGWIRRGVPHQHLHFDQPTNYGYPSASASPKKRDTTHDAHFGKPAVLPTRRMQTRPARKRNRVYEGV
jgi:hypothetical protein